MLKNVPFTRASIVGNELNYLMTAVNASQLAGPGTFGRRCELVLSAMLSGSAVLLTHSCTAALEMAALLADVKEGDEIILPSFTFATSATAFVLRGASLVFVDIRPDTLNLDEEKLQSAITKKTKVIVPVHYAGIACEMDAILNIASQYNLVVVEDAAQGLLSSYKGRPLGTLGSLGCISFHETKNVIAGEGGALVINDKRLVERAEMIREKGTDRTRFFRGQVDKYTWRDIGSSYCPSELNAAFLLGQLEGAERITNRRRAIYRMYLDRLTFLSRRYGFQAAEVAPEQSNGHIYWIRAKSLVERTKLIAFLKERGINCVFHYIPLHSSPAGLVWGRAFGELAVTDAVADTLLRLPLFYGMSNTDVERVVDGIEEFYSRGR